MLRVVLDSPQLSVDVFFDDSKVRLEAYANRTQLKAHLFLNNALFESAVKHD